MFAQVNITLDLQHAKEIYYYLTKPEIKDGYPILREFSEKLKRKIEDEELDSLSTS